MKTWWNLTCDMLERAIKTQRAIDVVANFETKLKIFNLTKEEWELISLLCKLLTSFKETSDWVCTSSLPTLTTAMPAYNFLFDQLDKLPKTHTCSAAMLSGITAAKDKLSKYYGRANAPAYPIATVLDPCLKTKYYKKEKWSATERAEAKEIVVKEFETILLQLNLQKSIP